MRANSLCKPRVSRFCCAHSHAYDSRLRAAVYADAVSALEDRIGHPVMSRNIAAGRAIHPDVCGPSALASLVRIGKEGCALLAEAGPADDINAWTEDTVYASTDTGAPMPTVGERRPQTRTPVPSWLADPPERVGRGC